jgi:hypothetical protein
MTSYRKTMSEAYNSMYLAEDNMALMKKAAGGANQTIKMKDGKLQMDSFTASAIMAVYNAVNPKNKKSMENMINSGSKSQIMKLQSLAMRQIKSSHHEHEEVELDEGTWELPRTSKQKAGLKKALSKPIKLGKEGETARNVIGPFIGDDELFDDLMDAGDENPKSDARPIIKKAMKRLGIKEEVELDENKGLENKSKKSGVSVGILKKVYSRGLAAYKTGHRPGTTAPQWAMARVNSFLTGGGARKADADLWKQAKGQKEEVELDEASARADAMRAMRKGKEVDPADLDSFASDDDIKAASKNIIMQMRKAVSLRGNFPVEFMDKKKVKVSAKIAAAVQNKYNSMRRASEKEKFQAKIAKSYKDMLSALKESLGEKFDVKTAATKKGKISVTSFDNLKDAEKHLAGLQKKGHKGIISKNGKPIKEDMTVTASTDGGISQRDLDHVQKELRKLGIKDAVVDQNEMDSTKIDVKTRMSNSKVKKAFDKSKMTVTYEHVQNKTILDRVGKKLKERKNG